MNISKRYIITVSLLAIAVIAALYFVQRSARLADEISSYQKALEKADDTLEATETLNEIDDLIASGRYPEALRALNELEAQDSVGTDEISKRRDLANRLLYLERRVIALSDSSARADASADSMQQVPVATPEEIRSYDSLQYALEKASIQIAYLRKQLEEKTAGTYLTFPSSKGNSIHYVGEVSDGKANGRGIGLFTTGSRYVGKWKNNMRHGEGTFYWPDGEFYTGSYRNDRREGQGTYHWPSGEKFVGQWANDARNGQGTFYGPEGDIVAQGVWENDELVEVEEE